MDKYQKTYKPAFVTTTLGLPSLREFPKGQNGQSDIDSGPIILGVGFSGTIVSIGTFSVLSDLSLADKQYKTINAFGFSNKIDNQKKYIFGLLPIADAFIAWGRATKLNNIIAENPSSGPWRIKFHSISLITILAFWALFYYKRIFTKLKIATQ